MPWKFSRRSKPGRNVCTDFGIYHQTRKCGPGKTRQYLQIRFRLVMPQSDGSTAVRFFNLYLPGETPPHRAKKVRQHLSHEVRRGRIGGPADWRVVCRKLKSALKELAEEEKRGQS